MPVPEPTAPGEAPLPHKARKALRKAEKYEKKAENARRRIPKRRRLGIEESIDPKTGRVKRRLGRKETPMPQGKPPGPASVVASRAGMATLDTIHKKMHEVEKENVAVEAAHKAETFTERSAIKVSRVMAQRRRTAPARRALSMERKAGKAHARAAYSVWQQEHPEFRRNLFARLWHKRKIQRQYASAKRASRHTVQAVQMASVNTGKIAKKLMGFFRKYPAVILVAAVVIVFLMISYTLMAGLTVMGTGGVNSIYTTSYTAPDDDINKAELAYLEWEADLQLRLMGIESANRNYDDYDYSVDEIGHSAHELMAYLTAKYDDFSFPNVRDDLWDMFTQQYELTLTPVVEARYRTEYYTYYDEELEQEITVPYEVPYDWHVLQVTLVVHNLTDIIAAKLPPDKHEQYGIYMLTKGQRAYLTSIFDFDWYPYMDDPYGWRVAGSGKDYNKGADISVSGKSVKAGMNGVVTAIAKDARYGTYIVIEGEKGLTTKYAGMTGIPFSVGHEVKRDTVIGKTGSTLHLEIIKDGIYLNPFYFMENPYYTATAPGLPGGPSYALEPGSALGEDAYAALIREAEKHLGKKYVFGASGPKNFDCSGFVCWVFTKSGVRNLPRTTAQGIFNKCKAISPADAKPGDIIFFQGTYSTNRTVTHVGIYVGNNRMIHCGNPIQYTSINTSYWKKHFYSFGRLS